MDRHARAVADMLGEDNWLLGEDPTLTDLAVYGMFKALADADIALALIEKYPTVPAWMARVEKATGRTV